MLPASRSLSPVVPVLLVRSEPARSTIDRLEMDADLTSLASRPSTFLMILMVKMLCDRLEDLLRSVENTLRLCCPFFNTARASWALKTRISRIPEMYLPVPLLSDLIESAFLLIVLPGRSREPPRPSPRPNDPPEKEELAEEELPPVGPSSKSKAFSL